MAHSTPGWCHSPLAHRPTPLAAAGPGKNPENPHGCAGETGGWAGDVEDAKEGYEGVATSPLRYYGDPALPASTITVAALSMRKTAEISAPSPAGD